MSHEVTASVLEAVVVELIDRRTLEVPVCFLIQKTVGKQVSMDLQVLTVKRIKNS